MVSSKNRNRAIEWLNSKKRDFNEGLSILQSSGYKPGVLRVLAKHGQNGPSAMERLSHHMTTYANMTTGDIADDDAEMHVFGGEESPTVSDGKSVLYAIKLLREGKKQYPDTVTALLQRYAHRYETRSKNETELANLPEDNSEEVVNKRLDIATSINECTDEMERLYPLWARYANEGVEPTIEEVEGSSDKSESEESESEEETGEDDPYSQMSKEELQAQRRSISTKISRAQNMLDYQQEAKGETPNPMLDPVKITKYKAKIERLTIELEKVKLAIAKFG